MNKVVLVLSATLGFGTIAHGATYTKNTTFKKPLLQQTATSTVKYKRFTGIGHYALPTLSANKGTVNALTFSYDVSQLVQVTLSLPTATFTDIPFRIDQQAGDLNPFLRNTGGESEFFARSTILTLPAYATSITVTLPFTYTRTFSSSDPAKIQKFINQGETFNSLTQVSRVGFVDLDPATSISVKSRGTGLFSFSYDYTLPPPKPFGTRLSAAAVPEPASWAMMVAGFGVIGAAMRRRRAGDRRAPALA